MFGRLVAALLVAQLFAASASADDESKTLNVYNWSDYIADDTVSRFETETGIKIHYDVYDSNETLEAKLMAGHSGYDLVVPSTSPFFARQILAGVYQALDKAKLANYGNLDPQILAAAANADPGNLYGVPYLWGTTGIGYNPAKVKAALGESAPVESLKLIFDPANAKKLAQCGLSLLDTPQEVFPAALLYLGRDPLAVDAVPALVDAAEQGHRQELGAHPVGQAHVAGVDPHHERVGRRVHAAAPEVVAELRDHPLDELELAIRRELAVQTGIVDLVGPRHDPPDQGHDRLL